MVCLFVVAFVAAMPAQDETVIGELSKPENAKPDDPNDIFFFKKFFWLWG